MWNEHDSANRGEKEGTVLRTDELKATVEPMPGTGWVSDGQFNWVPPADPKDKGPILFIGSNVLVSVNGRIVSGRYVLQAGDEVQVLPDNQEPVSRVEVEVSTDRLTATVSFRLQPGRKYRLKDTEPGSVVDLQAELMEEIPPPPITEEAVYNALRDAKVVYGIKQESIHAFVEKPHLPRIVATGDPVVEPFDGEIEYLFQEVEYLEHDPTAFRVDVLDRSRIAWVEKGTVLARRKAPIPGKPGRDVFGREIMPRVPKDVQLRSGPGTELSEDGNAVVAAIDGRPVLAGKTVKVIPSFLHRGDVDTSSGHLRFAGDLQITGQVKDGLKVYAGGKLQVLGVISGAEIQAELGADLRDLVIGSKVRVGGNAANVAAIIPVVEEVVLQLNLLLRALRQLETQGVIEASKKKGLSYGLLLKQLLESRFRSLTRLLEKARERFATIPEMSSFEAQLANSLAKSLLGSEPLKVESTETVQEIYDAWQVLQERLSELSTDVADLTVKGLQNCEVFVSGKLTVTRLGIYNSMIHTGRGIECVNGTLRGGQVSVQQGLVTFNEVGGRTGVPTVIIGGKDTVVTARFVHPGVIITLAGQKKVLNDAGRNLKAKINASGELEIDMGPA